MIKAHGILFVESQDKQGETILVDGADLKLDHAPVKSANGYLLGKVLGHSVVYGALTQESIELAMKAGLKVEVPANNDENSLTGITYLQLEKPFVKINVSLIENMNLREAIREGNLYFGIHGKVLERHGNLITKCVIDSVLVGISPTQPYTKIFLDSQ